MCLTNGTRPLSYELYRRGFKSMNIAIDKPKKDQCKTCTGFNNIAPTEHEKKEHERHIQKKNQAYHLKEKIKQHANKNPETIAITFDLEAILYTSCTKVSTLFYKRKLGTYNLTMFSLANKEGHCFL